MFCTAWKPHIGRYLWIGGRIYNGVWQWDGRRRKDIVVEDWNSHQPDNYGGNQSCLALFDIRRDKGLQWDDGTCTSPQSFLCERY